jgi:3-carboxy-cis,cis-muconate cycloisomerase
VSDLYWPGDHRAGDVMSGEALVEAMVRVESAWLAALVDESVAPAEAATDLAELVGAADVEVLADRSEADGNPVTALLALLRSRLPRDSAATTWVHRGLTSQDVLDTALMLCLRDALDRVRRDLAAQVSLLSDLARAHRSTLMVGRTLTQHAVPFSFGRKAAVWLEGVLDAAEELERVAVDLPVQLGGAVATLAATSELARLAGRSDGPVVAMSVAADTARTLGLSARSPWQTVRAPLTTRADALVGCTDAWGRMANDVLTLSRPEIAELAESAGVGGGSSTMPNKRNPVLSVLIRRAALSAPSLGAQLHLAAAESLDERSDGAWHLEWATLRTLARRTVVAASQTTDLLSGLEVDSDQMQRNLDAALPSVLAERDSLHGLGGDTRAVGGAVGGGDRGPADYLGATDLLIDAALDRAARGGGGAG